MAGVRVHIVMPQLLVERIDAALGPGRSRGEFVRRAVERALGDAPSVSAGTGSAVAPVSPAPAGQRVPSRVRQARERELSRAEMFTRVTQR